MHLNRLFIKRGLFSLVLLTSLYHPFFAQQDVQKDELRLLARPFPDSISLRWAPTSYTMWLAGNKYGYKVTKTLLMKDGELLENRTTKLLTVSPLKPRPLDDWERLDATDDYAGIAAQAIYGDEMEPDVSGQQMSIMEIFNKATEQENRFGFALYAADMSPRVAKHHGLMLVDKAVKKGEKYLYRVFLADPPVGVPNDTAVFFTGVDEHLPLPAPIDVRAKDQQGNILLTWDNKYQTEFFNAFFIERSGDGGKSFKRLNDVPMINTTPEGMDDPPYHYYLDTIPVVSHTYHYRVIGISVFGELSPPSKVIEAKGKVAITTVPVLTGLTELPNQQVKLQWEMQNAPKEKIQGYRIYRSNKYDKGFTLLADSISVVSNQYIDKQPLPVNYYRMQAFNADGNGPSSIPKLIQLNDSIPPAPPVDLKATIDTSGVVHLSWAKNTEADIYGYRVYRSNSLNEEFASIVPSPIPQNAYTDKVSVKTLTKHVFYVVKAYDKRQNPSDFSKVLKVERPDLVPPVSPLLTSALPTDSCIHLTWVNSSSDDVKHELLYRNRLGGKDWTLVHKSPANAAQGYTDKALTPGFTYQYLMLAVDSTGNESKPGKPMAVNYAGKKEVQWIEPVVKNNKKQEKVILSWTMPAYPVNRFLIYARKSGEPWQMIDGVDSNVFVYESVYHYNKGYQFIIKTN